MQNLSKVESLQGNESPKLVRSNRGGKGVIGSFYLAKDVQNISQEELTERENERLELLGLTPVPGHIMVTRKTYQEMKQVKRRSYNFFKSSDSENKKN